LIKLTGLNIPIIIFASAVLNNKKVVPKFSATFLKGNAQAHNAAWQHLKNGYGKKRNVDDLIQRIKVINLRTEKSLNTSVG